MVSNFVATPKRHLLAYKHSTWCIDRQISDRCRLEEWSL